MSYLSGEQINAYQDDGFLIVRGFASDDEINNLKQQAKAIIDDFDMNQVSIFTTNNQSQHSDDYFLESGDKARCFFEEEAFDSTGKLKDKVDLSINKIGHAMHDLLPEVQKFSYSPKMLDMVTDLGLQNPGVVQSQFIFKQPKIGGEVHAHTDSTFIHTSPLSCIGVWLALEKATVHNGCLSAIPGSHKWPLQEQFVRNSTNTGTEFIETQEKRVNWDLSQLVQLEVEKGDLVILHGQVVHASNANRSANSRHSYIIHLVDLEAEWSSRNWLQRPASMPFRKMEDVLS